MSPFKLALRIIVVPVAIGLSLAGTLAVANGEDTQSAFLPAWRFDGFAPLVEVPEPSGLCYHPERDSLFIVDDGDIDRPGGVYELNLSADVLNSSALGIDLEGICYCGLDGLLYVAEEMGELIYVVDPKTLDLVGQVEYSRKLADGVELKAGGNGVEGIEFIQDGSAPGGGYFILLNQDDPHCLFRLDYASIDIASDQPVQAVAWWPLVNINLGELHYDTANSELWVVHSWMNVMEVLDIGTMEIKRWEVVPGSSQEAVAVDGQGRLWIGYDLGGIARYVRDDPESAAEPATADIIAE